MHVGNRKKVHLLKPKIYTAAVQLDHEANINLSKYQKPAEFHVGISFLFKINYKKWSIKFEPNFCPDPYIIFDVATNMNMLLFNENQMVECFIDRTLIM